MHYGAEASLRSRHAGEEAGEHDTGAAGATGNGRGEAVPEGVPPNVVSDRTPELSALRDHHRGTTRRRARVIRRSLLVADVVTLATSFLLPLLLLDGASAGISTTRGEIVGLGSVLLSWLIVATLHGLYTRDDETVGYSTVDELATTFALVTVVGAWLFFVVSSLGVAQIDATRVALSCVLASILVPAGRAVARAYFRRRVEDLQNTVIVGAGRIGQLVARKLLEHPEYGLNLVGFVDAQPKERRHDLEELTLLGSPDRLPAIIDAFRIERVIVAFSSQSSEQIL